MFDGGYNYFSEVYSMLTLVKLKSLKFLRKPTDSYDNYDVIYVVIM